METTQEPRVDTRGVRPPAFCTNELSHDGDAELTGLTLLALRDFCDAVDIAAGKVPGREAWQRYYAEGYAAGMASALFYFCYLSRAQFQVCLDTMRAYEEAIKCQST